MIHVLVDLGVNINNATDKLIINSVVQRKCIQVAVGIVANKEGLLLVAKRPDHWLGGGFWEFPGGKIEANEDPEAALKRELLEEVGITIESCSPLIHLKYDYPERTVFLHAWRIQAFTGQASGLEGQEISWQLPAQLNNLNMLAANRAIVVAVQLPDLYLITPDPENNATFLHELSMALDNYSIKLVQLRAKNKDKSAYIALAREVLALCQRKGVKLLLNYPDPSVLDEVDAAGIHLTAKQAERCSKRPLPSSKWVVVSCHNEAEIVQAEAIGADFIVLGPVGATPTKKTSLGWQQFGKLVKFANLPVYALGGMQLPDKEKAKTFGAQGIAAIRSLWPETALI